MTPPKTGEYRTCAQCSGSFYARPSDDRRGSRRKYCSKRCQGLAYAREGNPKWRGGRTVTAAGYVHVFVGRDHPQADKHGYYEEHRHVIEQHLGRTLLPTECVHHINHVRDDNRIENLMLMESWAEHQITHAEYREADCGTCGVPVRRSKAHRRRHVNAYCSRRCAALAASRASAAKAGSR